MCIRDRSRIRSACCDRGISLGMASTILRASWEFHCFSCVSAAFHKVLRSAYSLSLIHISIASARQRGGSGLPGKAAWNTLCCRCSGQGRLGSVSYTHLYLLDVLLSPAMEERAALIIDCGKEVSNLERRMAELAAGDTAGRRTDHARITAAPER